MHLSDVVSQFTIHLQLQTSTDIARMSKTGSCGVCMFPACLFSPKNMRVRLIGDATFSAGAIVTVKHQYKMEVFEGTRRHMENLQLLFMTDYSENVFKKKK